MVRGLRVLMYSDSILGSENLRPNSLRKKLIGFIIERREVVWKKLFCSLIFNLFKRWELIAKDNFSQKKLKVKTN